MSFGSDELQARGLWAWERGLLFLAEEGWSLWLQEARRAGEPIAQVRSLNALGCVQFELGRIAEAQGLWEQAHGLLQERAVGDPLDWVKVLSNLSLAAYQGGRMEDAQAFLREAQRYGLQVESYVRAHSEHMATNIWLALGQWDEAEAAARRALELLDEKEHAARIAQLTSNLGLTYLERGDHRAAREHLETAGVLMERLEMEEELGYTYCELGRLHYLMGDLNRAAYYGSEALRVLWSNVVTIHKSEIARVSELFGSIALATGDRHTALMDLQRASTYFAQSSMWHEWSRVNRELDKLVRQRGPGRGFKVSPAATIHPESKERLRYFTTLLDLLDSIESLYPEMRQKAELSGRYALRLGQIHGLTAQEREALQHAAKLHDIGLTSLDPEVVQRGNPQTPAARDRIQAHPLFGEKILSLFPVPDMCREAVKHHHERYDGRGFPDGLAGEEIPVLARIIAVAGTYVGRALQQGHTAAMEELMARRGRHLDPRLVDAFARMHEPAEAAVVCGARPLPS